MQVDNYLCQPKGTADDNLFKCTIKLHLTVKTATSCRSLKFPSRNIWIICLFKYIYWVHVNWDNFHRQVANGSEGLL